jgi:hypothetical protein
MAASPEPRSGDDTYDLIDQAERWLPQHAHDARGNGHSREQIARALATSPAEARLRSDPGSPVADGRWPHDF